jgi:hypothetical protein
MKRLSSSFVVGFTDGKTIRIHQNALPFDAQIFGEIKATRGIFFSCGEPDTKILLQAARRVQKLLFINSCDTSKIKLSGLFKKGVIEFALQNPETKFIDFHTPSLLSALLKSPGLNPVEALNAPEKHQAFFKQLGWTQPQFDQGIGAHRAQSAVEAIDWFRL